MSLLKSSRQYQDGVRRVAGDFGDLLARLAPDVRARIRQAMTEEAHRAGLVYESDDGSLRTLDVMLRPRLIGANQRRYLHEVCCAFQSAHEKVLDLWLNNTRVRRMLPLTEPEERWVRDLSPPGGLSQRLFCRFDASVDFADADWVNSTPFFEANMCGVGGIYYTATADELIMRIVAPLLQELAPALLLAPNDDPRLQLLEVLADRARELGLHRFNVALAQFKDLVGGPPEFQHIEDFMRRRGVNARWVDPRDLRVKKDELWAGDEPIDIVYRDHEVHDLATREAAGQNLDGLKWAFRNGRVVSSLAGEFDHKSAFEVFTSEAFLRAFSGPERKLFRRHLPWTRIVRDAVTTGPDGDEVELLEFIRTHRQELVLKPNRGYGGEGITLGKDSDEWDALIQRAVAEPGDWVVQKYRHVAEKSFPRVNPDGSLRFEDYYCVLGFYTSPTRLGILGRVSQKRVVNVAQKGGLVSVLTLL